MQHPSHGPSRRALTGPYRWVRARPAALDAGLAAAVLGLILIGGVAGPYPYTLGPVGTALAVVNCASLVLRRRFPRGVLAFTGVVSVLWIVLRLAGGRAPVVLVVVVALYTVASRTDRPTTWRIGILTCAGLTAVAMALGPNPWYAQDNVGVLTWTVLAAAVGDSVRSRRAYVAAIEERAERAERTREEEAKRRVAEERMRIARELHDVVAHHITLAHVQTGVAEHVMDNRPDQAKQALAHAREAGRCALDELRATIGLLRQSGDPAAPLEPAPGLGVLDQLVEGFTHAGLPVDVRDGDAAAAPLPARVDLTAYRVIQESLTNVRRHAGPGARAEIRIERTGGVLEVVVDDDGGEAGRLWAEIPCPSERDEGSGQGLLGIRERAAALGGTCEAGRRPEGGFRVSVRLPLAPPVRPFDSGPPHRA